MVLSADDMGIHKLLIPIFCTQCGCRIGWAIDEPEGTCYMHCETCSKTENCDKVWE